MKLEVLLASVDNGTREKCAVVMAANQLVLVFFLAFVGAIEFEIDSY